MVDRYTISFKDENGDRRLVGTAPDRNKAHRIIRDAPWLPGVVFEVIDGEAKNETLRVPSVLFHKVPYPQFAD